VLIKSVTPVAVVDNVAEVPGEDGDDDKSRPFIECKLTLSVVLFSSDNSTSSSGGGIFLFDRVFFLSGVECDGGTPVCIVLEFCEWPESVVFAVVVSLPDSWASSFIHGESKQLTLRKIRGDWGLSAKQMGTAQ
jgi:hypothetical protein